MKKAVFLGIFAALSPLASAHAVVLEQKWTPGQDLNYQTALRGTMNLLAPANMNFPLAGVPFEVEVRGDGIAQFKTVAVDGTGIGTVAVRVPQFNLTGESWGQRGQLTLAENTSKFLINGKTIKVGDGTNPLSAGKAALRISPQGRVIGVENLDAKAPDAAKADTIPSPPLTLSTGARS